MILHSERLLLIAATAEMVRAEIQNRNELGRLVEAHVPADWPPPLNDENSQQWTLKYLLANPDAAGFGYWYIALPDQTVEGKSLVGIVGLKGKPAIDGTVEVGYSVMEDRQRQGYGSEATAALIAWVFDHPEVTRVVAETLPHLRPSIRVMERNGMSFMGSGSEEGVIRFGITRAEFEAARPKLQ
jgi:RimJ/RimL family protein N-acetyltransferase